MERVALALERRDPVAQLLLQGGVQARLGRWGLAASASGLHLAPQLIVFAP